MNEQNLQIVTIVISALALTISVTALLFSMKLKKWRRLFDSENQPDNLEEIITSITTLLKKQGQDHVKLSSVVENIEQTLQTTFQYSSVVRFDSLSNDGGNLSFTVALLNGQQTGMIITSLHGRENNRIYCKAIKEGQSIQPLNEEEQQALIEALTGTQKPKTKILKK